jgi:hypothetical protein
MGLVTTKLMGVAERLMAGRMRAEMVEEESDEEAEEEEEEEEEEESRRVPAAVYLGLGLGVAQLHMSLIPRLSWCMLMRKKPLSPQYLLRMSQVFIAGRRSHLRAPGVAADPVHGQSVTISPLQE